MIATKENSLIVELRTFAKLIGEEGRQAEFYRQMLTEAMPEIEEIAKELGIKVNNYKVLEEYRRRHPEEMKPTKQTEVKDGQEI